jgi:hypothetical protein
MKNKLNNIGVVVLLIGVCVMGYVSMPVPKATCIVRKGDMLVMAWPKETIPRVGEHIKILYEDFGGVMLSASDNMPVPVTNINGKRETLYKVTDITYLCNKKYVGFVIDVEEGK